MSFRAPSPSSSSHSSQQENSSTPAVKGCCRFRPQNQHELNQRGEVCVKNNATSAAIDLSYTEKNEGQQVFAYDRVFGPQCTQGEVFDHVVAPLVSDTLNGFNCTVIAYGQTGSGKTHTMEGPPSVSYDSEEAGVLPRVASTLFAAINETMNSEDGADFSYAICMSVIEIYLERFVDLLDPSPTPIGSKFKGSDLLKIREDASGGVYLEGVVERPVHSPSDLLACLDVASKKRSTGGHAMNARSSRSHLVAIVTVMQKKASMTTQGKLYICDLAGSEMVRKTEAAGQRLKEAQAINRSLSALGNVINALTTNSSSSSSSHIPYRDSKLTRLLQDSLGGNAKTALIVTASVSSINVSETLSTLRFGTRASRLRNKPRVNAERTVGEYKKLLKASDLKISELLAMIQELQTEITKLKETLSAMHVAGPGIHAIKRHQQVSEESDSDDEGIGWLPPSDDDLKVENEEIENLRAQVKELEDQIAAHKLVASEKEKEDEIARKNREEDEEKVNMLAKQEMLSQYTRGWQVGQRAAAEAYRGELDEISQNQREEEEAMKVVDDGATGVPLKQAARGAQEPGDRVEEGGEEQESYCQVCGLSESETAAHENADEENPTALGPLFTCDGNCNTFIHVSCAGLSGLPTGEWYCSDCADVPIDDPLPSPMRKEQHDSYDEAAAASLAELTAVRGRFVALRKQRDRLLARWRGERETQRRVEGAKRALRRKREEEIVRLREVVLVLQEEVDMSDEDRSWLKQVMDSTVAFSPSRLKRHQRGRMRGATKKQEEELPQLKLDAEDEEDAKLREKVELVKREQIILEEKMKEQEKVAKEKDDKVVRVGGELQDVARQFEGAKQQIFQQQRQIQKYMKIIQEQQKKLSGLKEEVVELKSVEKAAGVLEGSPFGELGSGSAPNSPEKSSDGAFGRMKGWWAGEELSAGEDKKIDEEDKRNGTKTEGVVKENAEKMTAPFRNRLIGLLSSIEKEAKEYDNLKERISAENHTRRSSLEERRGSVSKLRREAREGRGLPPRSGRSLSPQIDFSKTLPVGLGDDNVVGETRLMKSASFSGENES